MSKEVRFFPVYNSDMEKIGEVKLDPFRKALRWTALDESGVRIKDTDSRVQAEEEVRNVHKKISASY